MSNSLGLLVRPHSVSSEGAAFMRLPVPFDETKKTFPNELFMGKGKSESPPLCSLLGWRAERT